VERRALPEVEWELRVGNDVPFVPPRQGGKVQEAVRVEKAHAVSAHRVAHVEEPPEVQLFGAGRLAKAAEVMRGKECDAPALRKVGKLGRITAEQPMLTTMPEITFARDGIDWQRRGFVGILTINAGICGRQ
jgi:hypothetical protein